ncbi:MAG: hypothetical protein H0T46_03635 [Deltaproteobacteria bacterium]|nr:hypothetical protein [Deltaproteobacteria bacterium]
MRPRTGLVAFLVVLGVVMFAAQSRAEDDEGSATPTEQGSAEAAPEPPVPTAGSDDGSADAPDPTPPKPGDVDGDGTPDASEDSDGDGTPDTKEDSDGDGVNDFDEQVMEADVDVNALDADNDGVPDAQDDGDIDNDGVPDAEEEDPPTSPFDQDGDGVMSAEEIAERKEFGEFFDDIPNQPDDKALEARADDSELKASMTVEQFQQGVRIAKNVVLEKMAAKIAKSTDKKMKTFSLIVMGVSVLGLLLLLMPLFLKKKYPGQGANLFKYSALAAVTFIITVNLFGGVLFGLRSVQSVLSRHTNPSVAIASGTFDTLDDNADRYIVMGKELFMPTIEQFRNEPEEQPSVLLLNNGLKIVQDAKVFISIANMFKKVDFVFKALPVVLMLVTLILFVLAIRPTLTEIIKLPARAASGEAGVGKEVVANSLRRVKGELLASLGVIGLLVVITLISGWVLGQVVKPALDAFLTYFSLTVTYLQFAEGASSGLVFMTLFGVILFLVLNLATLILSSAFFLGKSQKIFQARFNEGTPVSTHSRFFKWGVPSLLLVQIYPWIFMFIASKILAAVQDSAMDGELNAESVSWGKMLMMGPALLVVGFVVIFWAVRGVKAIKFLATYKVKPKTPKPTAA